MGRFLRYLFAGNGTDNGGDLEKEEKTVEDLHKLEASINISEESEDLPKVTVEDSSYENDNEPVPTENSLLERPVPTESCARGFPVCSPGRVRSEVIGERDKRKRKRRKRCLSRSKSKAKMKKRKDRKQSVCRSRKRRRSCCNCSRVRKSAAVKCSNVSIKEEKEEKISEETKTLSTKFDKEVQTEKEEQNEKGVQTEKGGKKKEPAATCCSMTSLASIETSRFLREMQKSSMERSQTLRRCFQRNSPICLIKMPRRKRSDCRKRMGNGGIRGQFVVSREVLTCLGETNVCSCGQRGQCSSRCCESDGPCSFYSRRKGRSRSKSKNRSRIRKRLRRSNTVKVKKHCA